MIVGLGFELSLGSALVSELGSVLVSELGSKLVSELVDAKHSPFRKHDTVSMQSLGGGR